MKNCIKKAAAGLLSAVLLAGTAVPLSASAAAEQKTGSGIAFSDVKKEAEKYMTDFPDDYVGCGAAVVTGDEILFCDTYGYENREEKREANEETCFEWGSVTKTLVWLSVMQLWEQGKIDLDADIQTYLPDNFFTKLQYDKPITMMNLMNHSGGWGENTWAIGTSNVEDVLSLEDALRQSEPFQSFEPGTASSYSNWGASLAGFIVERVSGKSFADYVHENIFQKLGMEHTAIGAAREDNKWVQERRKNLVCYAQISPNNWMPAGQLDIFIMLYPCGAACGTIEDFAKYAQSFVTTPNPLFEKQETFDKMLEGSYFCGDTGVPALSYGLLCQQNEGSQIYGHNGATLGCTANLVFDPEKGYAIAMMSNCSQNMSFIADFPKVFLGEATADLPADYPTENTSHPDLSGLYFAYRSMWHGPMKFYSLLQMTGVLNQGSDSYTFVGIGGQYNDVKLIGDNILYINEEEGKQLISCKTNPDGDRILDLGAGSLAESTNLFVTAIAFVLYVLMLLPCGLLLMIKLIQRLIKRRKKYVGMGWMTAAQFARIISFATMFYVILTFSMTFGMLPLTGYITCGIQAACLLVFIITTISSLRGLFTSNPERASRFKYFVNFLANGISVFAVIMLELFRFWGI